MQPQRFELDVGTIFYYIRIASETIGSKWLRRKIKEEEERQTRDVPSIKNRKHSYLHRARPHPLVGWAMEVDRWRKACLATKRLELNEVILRFSILGRALDQARNQKGFSRLRNRLKQLAEFDAAAFEAEVAYSYIAKGWAVEFVEEGGGRSPDLKVTMDDGTPFWVECKCRDALTARDKTIQAFWTEMESTLLRIIGPKKLNFIIIVKALQDPDRSMLSDLTSFLLQAIDKGGIGSINMDMGELRAVPDPTGRFLLVAQRLAEPDEEIKTSGIGIQASEDFDRVVITAEMKVDEAGQSYFHNPVAIASKNAIPSDKVTGIVHAFKSAVGQLPKDGPGVVWIRIPDNAWVDQLDRSFQQAEALIKAQLTGAQNQRVNAVILMTRVFRKLQKAEMSGLAYSPKTLTIEHKSPRRAVRRPP